MRKDITLPALALAGGAAGFLLRRWQLASAYVPETGLFVRGAPATWALLGLTALLALAFFVLVRRQPEGLDDFLPAFGSPSEGQMTVFTAAGILLFAAGAFGLREGAAGLQEWRSDPAMYQLSVPVSRLLAGALCVPAGFGVLLMGRMAYRGEMNDTACALAPVPALAGLVWLFSTHLEHGTEPVLMKYGFGLFAALALTLAHYYAAGFLYGRPRPRRFLFFALLGAALGITSLAGSSSLAVCTITLALTLSALTLSFALLHNAFGPPRPKRLEGQTPSPEEDAENNA